MRRGGGGDDNQSGEAAAAAASLSRSLAVPLLPVFHVSENGLEAMILTSRRPSCIPPPLPTPPRRGRESVRSPRGESRRGESRTAICGAKGGRHLIGLLGRRQTQTGSQLRNTGVKVSEGATNTTKVPRWARIRIVFWPASD